MTLAVLKKLLFLLLLCAIGLSLSSGSEESVKKAIEFAKSEGIDDVSVGTLFKVAKQWKSDGDTDCWLLYKHLADEQEHVPSMAQIGHYFADVGDTQAALQYFIQAGENGPHHASLYNAGRLLSDQGRGRYALALAYLLAAATLHESHPQYASDDLTQTSLLAFETLSQQIARTELEIEVAADCFLYGNIEEVGEEVEEKWTTAILALRKFNHTFVESEGRNQDAASIVKAATALADIWDNHSSKLSSLQAYLLLDNMNDALGLLTGLSEEYVGMAGKYAEALANNDYCRMQYAVHEQDPACFNGAASSAMSYYRRLSGEDSTDSSSPQRILELGNSHPHASTKWKTTNQTPRVFHPSLTSKPWWPSEDFEVAIALQTLYKKDKKKLLKELDKVKALQEGRLRVSVEVDGHGNLASAAGDAGGKGTATGMQRIFTPYIGVRTAEDETATDGAGGWSEYGPLFDGRDWNEERCEVLPTICNALKSNEKAMASLCSSRVRAESIENSSQVWELCGSDTVVTVLRLRPGTTILPHCGTSNARLILHFPLVGAKGIGFTVGDVTVDNYGEGDGHPIVFDDSFEHFVHHGGTKDRYVLLVVLKHPDL